MHFRFILHVNLEMIDLLWVLLKKDKNVSRFGAFRVLRIASLIILIEIWIYLLAILEITVIYITRAVP